MTDTKPAAAEPTEATVPPCPQWCERTHDAMTERYSRTHLHDVGQIGEALTNRICVYVESSHLLRDGVWVLEPAEVSLMGRLVYGTERVCHMKTLGNAMEAHNMAVLFALAGAQEMAGLIRAAAEIIEGDDQ